MPAASELAVLVETEARLDRELADARQKAEALRDAGRQRAERALATLEAEAVFERTRISTEIEAATVARVRAVEEAADAAIARFEAIRGEELARIARRLVDDIVALVREEEVP